MLRAGLLWLSEQPTVFRFVRSNGLARRFASRFVAGETIDTAIAALRELNAARISASLDLLGESVSTAAEAHAARDTYLALLDRIHAAGADANVSVKLTQMGLDIDPALCVENLTAILTRAAQHRSFVRIDMEGSAYTERTLQMFFLDTDPRESWDRFTDYAKRVEQSGLGTVTLAAPFITTIPGTDTYTDELW